MSNSGKLALQLRAAPRAARPTTKLGAALSGGRLGATRGRDRRGIGQAESAGGDSKSGRQRQPRAHGAPGEAGREAGKGRGSETGAGARNPRRQGLRARGGAPGLAPSALWCVPPPDDWRVAVGGGCAGEGQGPEVPEHRDRARASLAGCGNDGPLLGERAGRQPRGAGRGSAADERQRPPRRDRGRCVHVRDSVRTVPGPVPASSACAVCLRPRAGGRMCSRASVPLILPGACVRACVSV